ncbi:MAG TPA: lipopolysaccharide heptosyltransferase II [Methylophilaceae bacterium]|jgi:heptosyltransferase-2|nr:lipopolysaccharide heptosyltransferase II [Methylophilaceae bacterium]
MAEQVLVIGPSWVGDMILAQSLFKLLKQERPGVQIDVAAPAWTLPLLERMPEVRAGIALPFRHGKFDLMARIRIGRELRGKYDQAILLTNSLKSAIVPFFANIPKRTGFRGEMRYGLLNDIRQLDKAALPKTVDRFIALGMEQGQPNPEFLPQPSLTTSRQQGLAALAKQGHRAPRSPVLALCPGAEYGSAKRWPVEYFAEVAQWALGAGWEVWLFGSGKDVEVTQQIDTLTANRCLDLGGKTSLAEAIDLMALGTTAITNDSGLMHVAAALDIPLLSLFGSSDPHHTPPMSTKADALYLNLSCSPCFKRECPLGHFKCMRDMTPQMVISRLQAISHA